MDAMVLLSYVLWSVVGVLLLGFGLKFLDLREQIAAQEETRRLPHGLPSAEAAAAHIPAFFGRPHASLISSAALAFDDRLFASIQDHILAEQAAVKEFVHLPSIDNLYCQASPMLTMH